MEVLFSIIVCILLSILLAFNVPIHKELSASLKLLVLLSAIAGLVGTITMFLEPIDELASTIPTPNEMPIYVFQGISLLVSFFLVWLLETVIGLFSAIAAYILRHHSGNPCVYDGLFLE